MACGPLESAPTTLSSAVGNSCPSFETALSPTRDTGWLGLGFGALVTRFFSLDPVSSNALEEGSGRGERI